MNLMDAIPVGKENKQTRQQLMYKLKITDEKQFKKELAKIKSKCIVLFDNGYYIPSSKDEYIEFIKKQKKILIEAQETIKQAQKEMEEL